MAKDLHSLDLVGGGLCLNLLSCSLGCQQQMKVTLTVRGMVFQLFLSVLFSGDIIAGEHDTRPNDWIECLHQLACCSGLVWCNMVNLREKA